MMPTVLGRRSRPLPLLLAALVTLLPAVAGRAAGTARPGVQPTALDRHVAAPDPVYRWKLLSSTPAAGHVAHTLEFVSQSWLTPAEVSQGEWTHTLHIIVPEGRPPGTALLYLGGGSHRPGAAPSRPSRDLIALATATGSVVAELRHVPNQPLTFQQDGRPRSEDDLIAYTWAQYLKTGDERWPARLPMTKAAVRALDTVTAFLATTAGGRLAVDRFVVAGASKRGWTAWTTALVDRRVVGLCPIVIDVLNVETSMEHHHRAYGFFAPAVGDYVRHGIMDWSGTPESRALYAIEDPYAYRDRATFPKLLINACGDQFFLPDSSRFYFDDLPGPKFLRYIPNTDHSLKNSDASATLAAWHHALITGRPLPEFTWHHGAAGAITVATRTAPRQVVLWQATNPAARDFRLETLGPVWKSTPVAGREGVYTARIAPPAAGWTAFLVELTFDLGGPAPLKLTTDVTVTPDTLPHGPPNLPQPKGYLTQ
jgi:PhoPQ-activated pathogenicity-related protein